MYFIFTHTPNLPPPPTPSKTQQKTTPTKKNEHQHHQPPSPTHPPKQKKAHTHNLSPPSKTNPEQVDHLAQLALNRPVRVRVDSSYEVAPRLEQEVCSQEREGRNDKERGGGWHLLFLHVRAPYSFPLPNPNTQT
jgi:hypothetical protein